MKKFIIIFSVIFSSCVQKTYVLKEGYALHRKEKVYTKFLFTAFPREYFTEEEEEICGKDYRLQLRGSPCRIKGLIVTLFYLNQYATPP